MPSNHFHQTTDSKAPNVVFMPGVFDETMRLLKDAHEYFYVFGPEDQANIDQNLKTLYSCEMSRITLRLSSVMAWLMVRRAIFTGKIAAEDSKHYALDFKDICMVDNHMLHGILPSYVCFLLDRTRELYERILRLDDQAQQLIH